MEQRSFNYRRRHVDTMPHRGAHSFRRDSTGHPFSCYHLLCNRCLDGETANMGLRALRVVPCAKLGIGDLVVGVHAKMADGDRFTVINRMLRSDKEVHVVDFVLRNT